MKELLRRMTPRLVAVSAGANLLLAGAVSAIGVNDGVNAAKGTNVPTQLTGAGGMFASVVNLLLFIVGAVAVLMIIIGAIRYVTSNGDQANVKSAKDTILYSIIGLIVALLAYAIVQFVVNGLATQATTP